MRFPVSTSLALTSLLEKELSWSAMAAGHQAFRPAKLCTAFAPPPQHWLPTSPSRRIDATTPPRLTGQSSGASSRPSYGWQRPRGCRRGRWRPLRRSSPFARSGIPASASEDPDGSPSLGMVTTQKPSPSRRRASRVPGTASAGGDGARSSAGGTREKGRCAGSTAANYVRNIQDERPSADVGRDQATAPQRDVSGPARRKAKRKPGERAALVKRAKRSLVPRRTRDRAFVIVCDAESVTHPELLECIDLVEELGTCDVGIVSADWEAKPDWRSLLYQSSKADSFKVVQSDAAAIATVAGCQAQGDGLTTSEVMRLARSDVFRKHEFCLVSADDSLATLAARLRQEGRSVRGIGRRQAPEIFLRNCDAFMYIDPANRYELLTDESLVVAVALCVALAAMGQGKCEWVRMKTIVRSLHAWDLGLTSPGWYGYSDYDEIVERMGVYFHGVEDTSGEPVVKVPPKPSAEVPRGVEDVATYLYAKWVSFTKDPQLNDILLACIPACVQAVALARAENDAAVRRCRHRGPRGSER